MNNFCLVNTLHEAISFILSDHSVMFTNFTKFLTYLREVSEIRKDMITNEGSCT